MKHKERFISFDSLDKNLFFAVLFAFLMILKDKKFYESLSSSKQKKGAKIASKAVKQLMRKLLYQSLP